MTTPTTALHRAGDVVALLTVGSGLGLAWGVLGADAFVMLALVVGVCGAGACWALHASKHPGSAPPRTQLLAVATTASAVLLAAIGLGQLAGSSGIILLAMGLSLAPRVHGPLLRRPRWSGPRWSGPRSRRERRTSRWTHPSSGAGVVQALDTMTLEQLCDGWTASYSALASTADAVMMERLSHLRQAYLDELERRYPDRFEAWLQIHADPGSDPQVHLASDDVA